jgi:pimeloyl-ACP methyl ester carboxylesterase
MCLQVGIDAARRSIRLTRRLLNRFLIVGITVVASALLIEFALEARDTARYIPGQTFATVGNTRIRYRLLGVEHPGATVVILSGLRGSIEQDDQLQSAVSKEVPSLTYDRAGYGFSQGSAAHSAGDQAAELAALLDALKIKGPVVLVPYSFSADLARVFAGRYPERTAGMYMIAPSMPDLHELVPAWKNPRRRYARATIRDLVESSFGYIRLQQRFENWQGPTSQVEQRAEAVLARRSHYWALAQEWYALPVSSQQALEAPVPPALPIEVAFPKQATEDETSKALAKLYGNLLARTSRGKLTELEDVDHSKLLKSGPAFDRIVAGIVQRSQGRAP